jgi:hypothetical protein
MAKEIDLLQIDAESGSHRLSEEVVGRFYLVCCW